MSASSDLNTLRERVEVLETELDRSRIDLEDSVDQIQQYRAQYDKLQARYTALRTKCNELKFDNRRLTRKVNEPNAQFASPPIAPQPGEVDTLRQRLAEKDQVIAAKDEKHQSLLDSVKPAFNNLKDAVKTFEALQNELAQGGPPSDDDANSKTSATQGATKTPSGHAGSKTSVTKGATKPPSKRPATRSKSPDPGQPPSKRPATRWKSPDLGQQPSIEGSETYSGVVTTKRAELPRRGRAGQARPPVSHEYLAKQEALQAEQREKIQRGAARSQMPSRAGGFQPSQKAPESSDFTTSPAAKPNVTDSQVPKEPWGPNFVCEAKPPSAPIAKEKVADSQVLKKPWRANFTWDAEPPSPQ